MKKEKHKKDKKDKTDIKLTPDVLLASFSSEALNSTSEQGHKMGEFWVNGDVCIASCTSCKAAVIIHPTEKPNGRFSGTAVGFRCRE